MDIEELKEALKDNTEIKDFVESMVTAELETVTTGLKDKNIQLLDEKKNLQTRLEGLPTEEELTEFKKLKEQIESSVDAKLIAEGKLDDVLDKRTARITEDFEAKMTNTQSEIKLLKESNSQLRYRYDDYVIEDTVRKSAVELGVLGGALDDVVSRANGKFTLDKNGLLEARDAEGKLVVTEDGKTLTPSIFITQLKESAPHFWPMSKGSGLIGDGESTETLAASAEAGDIKAYLTKRRAQRNPAKV